jgi:SAM-dependent methyltransferase
MASVAGMIRLLDNPFLWRASRYWLDVFFGLYRHRFRTLQSWGVLADAPSILDVGCGIGQYSQVTTGKYLGIDLSQRYIDCARNRYPQENRTFRCVDVTTLWHEGSEHDIVLLVDFLHHISDRDSVALLKVAGQIARRHVVSFEPLSEQTNPVGRRIVKNDRGKYMRPLEKLHGLFAEAGLTIVQSTDLYLGPMRSRAILCARQGANTVGLAA